MRLVNYAHISTHMYCFGITDKGEMVYNVFPLNDHSEKVVDAGGYYSLGYITCLKNVPYVKPSEAQILKYKEESDEKC